MTTNPHPPPPEGELIRATREAPPRMSIKQAAKAAGMSDTRWRQIEQGFRMHRGRPEPEPPAPAQTLAQMARAVGVSPAELRRVSRGDAAGELEAMPPVSAAELGESGQLDRIEQMNRQLLARLEDQARRIEYLENQNHPKGDDNEGPRRASAG